MLLSVSDNLMQNKSKMQEILKTRQIVRGEMLENLRGS